MFFLFVLFRLVNFQKIIIHHSSFRNEVAIYMATYSSLNGPYHGILKFLGRQGKGLDKVCQVPGKDDDATTKLDQ